MGGDSTCDKLSFLVTWDDPLSGISRSSHISESNIAAKNLSIISHIFQFRQFNLIFNPEHSTVEMTDNRSKKTFLKKTVTTEVQARGVYFLSGNINIWRNIHPWVQGWVQGFKLWTKIKPLL